MKIIYRIILFLIFAGDAFSAPLIWQDVLSEAKKNNPELIKAEDSVKNARLSYYNSYTNFLPQLSANAGVNKSKTDGTDSPEQYSLGLSGRLSLFSGFSDSSQLKSKNIDLKIAELEYKRILADVIYNLKTSFIGLLWAQETIGLSEEILKRRSENYDLVKFKYDAGLEDKGSLLRVEADKFQAEYDLAKAKRNLKTASAQVLRDIGRDEFEVITVTASFNVYMSTTIEPSYKLLREIPDYLIAEKNLEKSEYSVKIARSEFYPDLSISGSISNSGEKWIPDNEKQSLSLNLSYPFFPGGKNIYDLKIAKTNKKISEETFKSIRQQLMARLESVWNDFVDATENVKVSEKYFNASEQQSKIRTTKYVNGLVSYQDWYTSENDYISSKRAFLNSRRNAVISEISWKNFLGLGE
ncbi:MAG: hypothetical protein A2539_09340 [Elusimicrobia bacterium RIFOXYD2_FULL_34_15]|nr:MAG: hypothetical protein A2539_09340 [Elusimicrobia bacterium RIFOXYD2_FULL_34_15]